MATLGDMAERKKRKVEGRPLSDLGERPKPYTLGGIGSDELLSRSLLPAPVGQEATVRAYLGDPNLMVEQTMPERNVPFMERNAPSISQGVELAANILGVPGLRGIRAYHGSPHKFDKFDISRIGTGEGAQSYGHGLYFAENPSVAQDYKRSLGKVNPWTYEGQPVGPETPYGVRNALDWLKGTERPDEAVADTIARRIAGLKEHADFMRNASNPADRSAAPMYDNAVQSLMALDPAKLAAPRGHMYEVNIRANPEQFLDWDRPLTQQPSQIQRAIEPLAGQVDRAAIEGLYKEPMVGASFYKGLPRDTRAGQTQMLREAGIPGIKYLDQGSRNAGGWHITPNTQTTSGKWMVKSSDYNSKGLHFDTEAEAQRALAEKIGSQTSNYVLFDDSFIDILKRYGIIGGAAGGTLASSGADNQWQ